MDSTYGTSRTHGNSCWTFNGRAFHFIPASLTRYPLRQSEERNKSADHLDEGWPQNQSHAGRPTSPYGPSATKSAPNPGAPFLKWIEGVVCCAADVQVHRGKPFCSLLRQSDAPHEVCESQV